MQTRRGVVAGAAGALALLELGAAIWADADAFPAAKLVPGTPPILDYGGGVKVPCDRGAFFTLWEGSTFWLTFGFGSSLSPEFAKSQASKQAIGVMKFMLLTLAFAPERLVKNDGNGWRKKDPAAHDFVLGELDLPLRASKPMTDAFLGGGNTQISPFWNWGGGGAPMEGSGGTSIPSSPGAPTDLRQASRHAFCTEMVMKSDLSLADVRKRAVVLQM